MTQYDLHTHTCLSDGTLAPAALVSRAAAAGIDVLAVTDHDCTDGLAEAAAEAVRQGIRLVPGVEISVTWEAHTIHLVGLGIDPAAPALDEGLRRLRKVRDWRALEMARGLEAAGIPGALDAVRALAGGPILSRTHFARFLVAQGRARRVGDVYRRYLVRGRPGYVRVQWAGLGEAIGWIRAAGGEAVLAHPARYRLRRGDLERLLEAFRTAGGVALEVVSGSHPPDAVRRMARLARAFGLRASRGSDYHGPELNWFELGRLPPLPNGCVPVWADWAVAAPAAAAGLGTPA